MESGNCNLEPYSCEHISCEPVLVDNDGSHSKDLHKNKIRILRNNRKIQLWLAKRTMYTTSKQDK